MGTLTDENSDFTKVRKEKRQWIYAKKPAGKLYNYRQWVGYSLLLFLFAAPFIKVNGNPFLIFNIIERKFSIFGSVFYPQDLHIFVFGMLIMMVGIVLFTAVYGRVWCGWTCPQTIFMELIFRRIEYFIEGDWILQRKLNEGPDSDIRAWKKILKHAIFFAISFFISNIFLAYIIGVDALYKIMADPVDQHIVGFASIMVFTVAFYGVFAHLREIVCTTLCPYGRLQGVLLDEKSLTVAYDVNRGEPRGKLKKQVTEQQGDCVDCKLCVHVCPTGIDIRNGTQLECVNCTACIDACDVVMDKIGKPKRLIGFYSMDDLSGEGKVVEKSNTRAIAYSAILVVLTILFAFLLFNRSKIDARLLRATGSSYQLREDGLVSNLYTLELLNKSGSDIQFKIECADDRIGVQMVNNIYDLKKEGSATLSFFLLIDKSDIGQYKQHVKVNIVSNGEIVETLKTTFIAPPTKKQR
ncbi:cytochrome c oxidase accessory protein CcoG [Sphingobacterium haloxyli]|uniref:Cytochrome c oxidase accessory protein CcoG n=1 Tax=Sphingobacterium haloxyli TaxID=2100533 RepID=A0A2S9J187_9SPHI|nr:cytochrome c oxidase accessory protein CcoG [Sphingobacterium haloxyli]PRD46546.1 cytochrome c oxidase accessory protein CcoG [Sphingobacterium haloxyli]